jgi:predicted AlkP superfamily phosphohydrolase/phosphomutase
VGIDGASPRIVRLLLEQGRLPHLARIAEEGLFTRLLSFKPLLSPRIWTSIATGKTAHKHGIGGFVRRDDDDQLHLMASSDRKTHAIWNIVSDAGFEVAVVNWQVSHPPEKVRGAMVSDHAIPGAMEGVLALAKLYARRTGANQDVVDPASAVSFAYPESWTARVETLRKESTSPTRFANPFGGDATPPYWTDRELLASTFEEDGLVAKIALEIESELRPNLLMVYFKGIDNISHQLWYGVEPAELYPEDWRRSDEQRAAAAAALETYYEYTDALIGLLVARYAPEDLVMVISDHGFEHVPNKSFVSGRHWTNKARWGVLFARGRGVHREHEPGRVTVNDITPTILTWLGLPVARDMDGRPAPFLDPPTREPVASYDGTPIERIGERESPAEPAILERLRALGYLE